MIKFFRHIRKRLLAESRFSKYMLYAIGEIVLVVIGILIALQINNWNNGEVEKIEEQNLLSNLYSEFEQNLTILEYDISRIDKVYNAQNLLLEIIQSKNRHTQQQNLDSLLNVSLGHPTWNPSLMILDDIKNSGRLEVLTSHNLKQHLYKWNSFYTDYLEDIKASENAYESLINYINDHGDVQLIYDKEAFLIDNNANNSMLKKRQFINYFTHYMKITSLRRSEFLQAKAIITEFLNETMRQKQTK